MQDGRATLKHELAKLAFADGTEWAQDDVSGVELDPEPVKQAREVEMTFFRKMQVYTLCAQSNAEDERRKGHRGTLGGREQGRLGEPTYEKSSRRTRVQHREE